jgi:hypothetical protein
VDHGHGWPRDSPEHELDGATLLENSLRGRLEEEGAVGILTVVGGGRRGDGARSAMVLNGGGE